MKINIVDSITGNTLIVNINDNSCSMLTLFERNNYTKRALDTNPVKTPLPANFTIKNEAGELLYCIGLISDNMYKNDHMVIYDDANELLFLIPNVLHLVELYPLYNVEVVGVMLGTAVTNKNNGVETYGLQQKFNNKAKIKLNKDLLANIVISVDTLEIPGIVSMITNGNPISIVNVNAETSIYNSFTSIVIGLSIDFADAIISETVNCALAVGHNSKDIRAKTCLLAKDKVTSTTFKTVYILD